MMARLITALKAVGIAALLLCAVGNALLGDWGSFALAATAGLLLLVQK